MVIIKNNHYIKNGKQYRYLTEDHGTDPVCPTESYRTVINQKIFGYAAVGVTVNDNKTVGERK